MTWFTAIDLGLSSSQPMASKPRAAKLHAAEAPDAGYRGVPGHLGLGRELGRYSATVSRCSGAWQRALGLFWAWDRPDATLSATALAACGDWQVALALLQHLRGLRLRVDAGQVASKAAEAHQWQVALALGLGRRALAQCFSAASLWPHALRLAALEATGGAGHADVYAISMSSLQRLSRWQSEQLLFQVRSAFTCPKWPGPALLAVPLGRRVCLGTS